MNVVLQNPYINEAESVKTNLVGVSKSRNNSQLKEILKMAALEDIDMNDKASKLSGG